MELRPTAGFISAEVMPHSGGIIRTYRHRRVVERRQQIGPDIIDFCGGLVQRVDYILDMLTVKLEKTVPDRLRGNIAAADPYGRGSAAYHVQHQLQQVVYVIAGMLPSQTLVINIRFQFFSPLVSIYLQTRRRGLLAANLLAGRYNPQGKFIRAWNDKMAELAGPLMGAKKIDIRGWMIIDCMMNIPLLYWASEETKDPRFKYVAINHAKTAQQYIARPDGSCNHIAGFEPDTGEFVIAPGGQGYAEGSSWSRGQSWAVYGFALSYRHTKDPSFLDTAKRCAHYGISNMAVTDWLPLVDYRAPETPLKYDTTAAMITSCGLLEIARHVPDHEKRFYTEAAYRMLRACDEKFCNWIPQEDSIVDGGTYFYNDPTGENTQVPIIYADYYLIEAVLRLKGKDLFIW